MLFLYDICSKEKESSVLPLILSIWVSLSRRKENERKINYIYKREMYPILGWPTHLKKRKENRAFGSPFLFCTEGDGNWKKKKISELPKAI